jgi:iron-sulfur cluster repair protein YtfE (RIC family)
MELRNQITRRLHDEHEAAFSLIARVQRAFAGAAADTLPELAAPSWSTLLRDLHAALEFEIAGHFDIEERALFPLLVEAGEGDLVGILDEEHKVIRAIASPVIALLLKSRSASLIAADWRSLRALGLELCERLEAHARKEEAAMLPALETLLDPEQDRELIAAYADGS